MSIYICIGTFTKTNNNKQKKINEKNISWMTLAQQVWHLPQQNTFLP